MTDREKLIEMLTEPIPFVVSKLGDECSPKMKMGLIYAGKVADHLIANGVTFAKDTNVPSWIPVSERLPGIFQPVIVWTKFKEIGEAHYNGKRFQWIDDEGDYDYAYVTHWMPLPEPPRRNDHGHSYCNGRIL